MTDDRILDQRHRAKQAHAQAAELDMLEAYIAKETTRAASKNLRRSSKPNLVGARWFDGRPTKFGPFAAQREFRKGAKGKRPSLHFGGSPMANLITKIEGKINTAVGKIKQNADDKSFHKEGADQQALGEAQQTDSVVPDDIGQDS